MSPDPAGPGGMERPGAATAGTPSGFIDRYQVLEKIGEGGMGSVFLAWDPAIDRLVAVKLLRVGSESPETRQRFALEARAAGRLRHPNIVTIFDVGERDGVPFITMEFLPGETLHTLIRAEVRLPLARRIKLLEELCDGLAFAHRAGMVHRDVKPANLIVDSDGVLKILDFGIARLDEGGVTQAGVLVGTLNYMAPEQVMGGTIGPHSDIFAVGLVAYELLSGRQAFTGTIQDGLLNRIATVGIEPLPAVVPEIDPQLASIIERALELEPKDRYPDLWSMRNELIAVRKRLETSAETALDLKTLGSAETRIGPGAPTPLSGLPSQHLAELPSDAPQPALSLDDAERALNAGDYRTALSLAGRSAAADPGDPKAARIVVRAQSALRDRGRALESGGIRPSLGLSQNPGPVVQTPVPSAPTPARRTPLYAAAAAVVIAGSALAWWIVGGPRDPEEAPVSQTPPAATSNTPTVPPPQQAQVPPPPAPVQEETAKPPATPPAGDPTAERPADPKPAPPVRTEREQPRRPEPRRTDPPATPPAKPEPSGRAAERPEPPAPEPPAPRILVAGRDVSAPRRIRYVEPVYPPGAAEARLEGTVGVELTIGREGRVADARVTSSVPGLDQAALTAARQWQFQPVEVNGEAVPVIYTVGVTFTAPPKPAPEPPPPKPTTTPPAETKVPPKAPEKPVVDIAAEEAAVRSLLRQYAAAWEARDADAVGRLRRLSADALGRVRSTLNAAAEYRMEIDVQKVAVDPDGRHARVSASVTTHFRPRRGLAQNPPPADTTFTLEKRDSRWLIVDMK